MSNTYIDYDNTNNFLFYNRMTYGYVGDFGNFANGDCHHSARYLTENPDALGKEASVTFCFKGTQFGLVMQTYYLRNQSMVIQIDEGEPINFTAPTNIAYQEYYKSDVLEDKVHKVKISQIIDAQIDFLIDVIRIYNGTLLSMGQENFPKNPNLVQLTSKNYQDDNVIRRDYVGNLDDSSLGQIDVIETINKVNNNEVKPVNKKVSMNRSLYLNRKEVI